MSRDIHSENMLGSSQPLKLKRTERTQAAQTTAETLAKYAQRNTSGVRRLNCSLASTVNLKRKLLVCGFTATDFSLRK